MPIHLKGRHFRSKGFRSHLLLLGQVHHRAEGPGQRNVVQKAVELVVQGKIHAAAAHLAEPAGLEAGGGGFTDLFELLEARCQVGVAKGRIRVEPGARSHFQPGEAQQELGRRNPGVALANGAFPQQLLVFVGIVGVGAVVVHQPLEGSLAGTVLAEVVLHLVQLPAGSDEALLLAAGDGRVASASGSEVDPKFEGGQGFHVFL